jgi:hypothetical protein
MTYKEVFQEISLSKDKYKISNLLNQLLPLEPDENYIPDLIDLTKKVFEIKADAIGVLSNFNNKNLESFFLTNIESENNKTLAARFIRGLYLNGTEKSIEFLIDLFKNTNSIDIKSEIVLALRILYVRNKVSGDNSEKIFKLIGNRIPFFQGYWTDLKKAKKIKKENWLFECESQLHGNSLNILFEENDKYDIHISIEKMNKDFIRYIHVYCIYKKIIPHFSKYYTPSEFFIVESRLFDCLFEKTKLMRPDQKVSEISLLLNKELLPRTYQKVGMIERLGQMRFKDFKQNENEIFNELFGTNQDWILAHILTNHMVVLRDNIDKNEFIDFVINKWKVSNREHFAIIDYLESLKK